MRGTIDHVGELQWNGTRPVFPGWVFDLTGRDVPGVSYDRDENPTHLAGWPLAELVAVHAEHGEGASVPAPH